MFPKPVGRIYRVNDIEGVGTAVASLILVGLGITMTPRLGVNPVGIGAVYGNVVRVQLPLIITRQELDQPIGAIIQALEQVQTKNVATTTQ